MMGRIRDLYRAGSTWMFRRLGEAALHGLKDAWAPVPSFLIIGAQKAGTSALHNCLRQHPRLIPGRRKELEFFCRDTEFYRGYLYYNLQFPRLRPGQLAFETDPQYLYYDVCAERIYNYSPTIKLGKHFYMD